MSDELAPVEFRIVRETCSVGCEGAEGFTLGRIYVDGLIFGCTLEDEDRRLEEGVEKVYGKSAMPLGRYKLELYQSPKHGLVPLFKDVPGFTYTEIHKANRAEQLLGCVAVGRVRTPDGVADCAPVLRALVEVMQHAKAEGRDVYCTIERTTP
jgi:hypothetical protein